MTKLATLFLFYASLYSPIGPTGPTLAQTKSDLEFAGLNYFLEQAHPITGLIRDKGENFEPTPSSNRVASIAATGFGLASIVNAGERGLVSRAAAYDYALKVLKFARDRVPRHKGWFLHWVDWETGERAWNSETSTIDSAFFFAGALYAAQLFPHTEVAKIANQLYREADFLAFMTDDGALPAKRSLSMAWSPEKGFTRDQWDMYAEQSLLLLLGLGHPKAPLPIEVWQAWRRSGEIIPTGQYLMGADAGLLIHQYSQVFVDFRNLRDGFPNYYNAGIIATRFHKWIGQTDPRLKSLRAGFWGFSASETEFGYEAYDPTNYTQSKAVCISCVIGSTMFDSDFVLKEAGRWIYGPYRPQIWGRYGIVDSLDIDRFWFSHHVIGITVGVGFLSLANTDYDTSIWKTFMQVPGIRRAMARIERRN